jgi:hypothetical protein
MSMNEQYQGRTGTKGKAKAFPEIVACPFHEQSACTIIDASNNLSKIICVL